MKYYPEQTQDNINSILKSQNKTFDEMSLDLKNDPIELQQEIFSGKISLDKLGSIAEYLNMPIDALLSDTLNLDMNFAKDNLQEERVYIAATVLPRLLLDKSRKIRRTKLGSDPRSNEELIALAHESICDQAVSLADLLLKALKK